MTLQELYEALGKLTEEQRRNTDATAHMEDMWCEIESVEVVPEKFGFFDGEVEAFSSHLGEEGLDSVKVAWNEGDVYLRAAVRSQQGQPDNVLFSKPLDI